MSPSPVLTVRIRTWSLISICIFLSAAALVWNTRRVAAAAITVNSLSDVANASDGLCTLREAITAANNNVASGAAAGECVAGSSSGSDVINITAIGTINLTGALPEITSDMSINGPGSGALTVRRDTGGDYRIFLTNNRSVNFSGMTITNGKSPDGAPSASGFAGAGGSGGGIAIIGGSSILNDLVITGNRTGKGGDASGSAFGGPGGTGGGIFISASNITMTNCIITNNIAGNGGAGGGGGGGIFMAGSFTLTRVTVNDNVIGDTSNGDGVHGGGIYAGSGVPNAVSKIINSTIKNNRTGSASGSFGRAGLGGGIGLELDSGTMTVMSTVISGNTTGSSSSSGGSGGGGVYSLANSLILVDTTISGNTTGNSSSSFGQGAGVFATNRPMNIINCTITGNLSANGKANGLFGSSFVKVINTIIANPGTSDIDGVTATNSLGHNLIGKSDGTFGFVNGTKGDQVGTSAAPLDPKLGALANNGGLTETHALLSNSPALDAGDNCVTDAAHCGDANIPQVLTDQRGLGRLVDGPDADTTATVDIGAYETQPTLANIADTTTLEDTQLAVAFDAGDATSITSLAASNGALVPNDAAHLSGSISGTSGVITINPAANQNGTTNIAVTVSRPGGPESKTFQVTVTPVNDIPSFTKGPDQTINEDAGAQTVTNWATNVSAGPNEASQNLTFQVTNNTNAALFLAVPAISSAGTLTYTPTANASGTATISINLKDDGGTANGGVDTTATQTFTITVTPVNDAPSFTKGADQTVNNNAGAQNVSNWATNISRGPSDESLQTVSFQLSVSNPALFSAGPVISSAGSLTYTPSSSAGGTATITVTLKDNGGTSNGGVDTSPPQTFTITVVPVGGSLNFASSTANTTENSGSTTVNVVRTGDTSRAVMVNYATNADPGVPCSTANGVASPKCDFTAALGSLSFAVGETSKSITILLSQDSFVEGPENITVTLSNPTNNAALGSTPTETVTITDDVTEPPTNIIDDPNMFVRMHYHDFLNREGDQSGIDFWTGQMTNCGSSDLLVCRVNVSGAFFLSIEFQQTGYLVERMYRTAYGQATGISTIGGSHQIFVPVVRANEFLTDTQRMGRGLVVGQPGWETVLENNKQAYALEFVQTARFISAQPISLTPSQFVDRLNLNAGNVLSASERTTAINLFGGAGNTNNVTARAQAVRQIAEDQDLYNAEFNRAFVLAQFFGYLRRNANDAPDTDYTGFDFWLTKLNQFNGNYIAAEMVKAFIASDEYRKRFGP